ncbi:LppP/LprE family lipoprotein [Gordonia sp. HY285]|uniref:LppP/LprE family lipoprotein n=1 Tax=Gordonia liuliyuniae TaxID=2911517 RepID=UPI001F48EE1B|nr:LppP/LprE family lipoprotein [Gordonia liuliyuniae]MCF8609439.1 LppP/LprE family lipoprotein [Gordonia liuliyuniae]
MAISVHPSGTKFVSATAPDGTTATVDVDAADSLATTPVPDDFGDKIAFYDLDGKPGAEIVVPVGMFGSNSLFQVYRWENGQLRLMAAPGETMNIKFGTGIWVFPGERILARAMCRKDKALALGSTEMPSPKSGRVIDFAFKPGSGAGEAGEWVVDGRRTVNPSEITDMSVGQQHFKCEDVRIKSLDSSTAPSTTSTASTTSCDRSKDMTSTVQRAIAALPTMNDWAWRTTATQIPEPCATLGFATTTVEMATNSSPVGIMLFHDGEYVGPAATCYPPVESVKNDGDDTVVVTYRYPNEGDSNADMTGRATLTHTWQDGKVVKTGDIPARLTQLAGCTP